MTYLNQNEGFLLLGLFGALMIGLVWLRNKREQSLNEFLIADRSLPAWKVGLSLAISWAWAPAFFVCALQSYNLGAAGIFWFTLPNIVVFFLFIPFAKKMRSKMPEGFTLPQYIKERYNKPYVHIAFLIAVFLQILVAFIANANAGGILLNTLSGIERNSAVSALVAIALIYSLKGGLRASVFTDILQMGLVLAFICILVPWVLIETGGFELVKQGLAGIEGVHSNPLHPGVAFAMGIPMSVVLLTTPLCDQIFVQRIFAVKERDITKALIIGGLTFGIIPISLSVLGFIGVSLSEAGTLTISNPEMVGPEVIGHTLPHYALYFLTLMAFAGLCSTIDSALSAASSLGSVDIHKTYFKERFKQISDIKIARVFMVLTVIFGLGIAALKPNILWIFMIGGSVTAATFFPMIFSLYSPHTKPRMVFAAVTLSLLLGLPYAIYANVTGDINHIVFASLTSLFIPILVLGLGALINSKIIAK